MDLRQVCRKTKTTAGANVWKEMIMYKESAVMQKRTTTEEVAEQRLSFCARFSNLNDIAEFSRVQCLVIILSIANYRGSIEERQTQPGIDERLYAEDIVQHLELSIPTHL